MKIISLNTWGGRIQSIDDFVQRHAPETDVFCFQEMYSNDTEHADSQEGERKDFFQELQELLPGFTGIFAEQVSGN